MSTEEYPHYLTVTEMANGWHVDLMEWSHSRQEYEIRKTTFPMSKREQAEIWAESWSEREGIEIR